MKVHRALILLLLLSFFCSNYFFAQSPHFPGENQVFDDESVPRVDISIPSNDLNQILFGDVWSNQEYEASFTFTNGDLVETVDNVGFRLRGNTSRVSAKKSFKVSFNTFTPGRKFRGLEKMNLNGEHNDPSMVRSKICWDWAKEMEIPASRSNHVELYINGDYFGLYTNVEHIDEEFVHKRFYTKEGNLFKCAWPADLNWLGANKQNYKNNNYELKTNLDEDDWSDFINFVDVLNNSADEDFPCEFEKIFNVDDYLKTMVLEIFISHWDGPIINRNNFYLYQNTRTGKFEYIPFDFDNTLGIDFFSMNGFVDVYLYDWAIGEHDFPLYERLMEIPKYRNQFTTYFRDLLESIDTETYFTELEALRDQLEPYVEEDEYHTEDYGFTFDNWYDSFTEDIYFWHVVHGITDYFTARMTSAQNQLESAVGEPVIKYVEANAALSNDPIVINAVVDFSSEPVWVAYEFDGLIETLEMEYDENRNQYSIEIPPLKTAGTFAYQIQVGETVEPCEYTEIEIVEPIVELHINEFMAENEHAFADEAGEYDDWIEIYNAGQSSVYLGDKFLTDNWGIPQKWAFPDRSIEPGAFLLLWADKQEEQGELHTNFSLNSNGEEIGIFDANNNPIDLVRYNHQTKDDSQGYFPNGEGIVNYLELPSPNASNSAVSAIDEVIEGTVNEVHLFPNPANEKVCFDLNEINTRGEYIIQIQDLNGKLVHSIATNHTQVCWNLQTQDGRIANGMYLVKVADKISKLLLTN